MRVLIAAGGTGGHIYPGIAVAQELMRRDSANEVQFVGTARGLEKRLVSAAGFELSLIESAGLKNVGIAGQIRGMLLLPKSVFAARRLLRRFRPDVVVGAGGYVSGPVLLTAWWLGIPTLVMDSNALPGFTNRVLARFVDRAALTFDESLKFFPRTGTVTGNPVRTEFFGVTPVAREGRAFSLLIFGGSQGARGINRAMVAALPLLADLKTQLSIVHQAGEIDFDEVESGYTEAGWDPSSVRRYIDNMVSAFQTADLIISRAGATTCAELAAAGKAAVMVPLPTAADDHQRKNAEAFVTAGAARMILQKDLTGDTLAREIRELVGDPARIDQMQQASQKFAKPSAASGIADLITGLAVKKD